MVRYCSACWRKEYHRTVTPFNVFYGMALVGTLGLAWFFRPRQCVCCGKLRII
jgi:hypothetical protein